MVIVLSPPRKTENSHDLSAILKTFDSECKMCNPITPLECIKGCKVYKLKNELRTLNETMDNPNYVRDLFNVLKNAARLQTLQTITNGKYSVSKLQEEFKKAGHRHNQDVVREECLQPLITVGLAAESRDEYYATKFGSRLVEVLGCFPEFATKLPAHSECYDETLLQSLLSEPKTFEEIKALVSPKSVARILKRLRSTGLINTPNARDYVFYVKSKRDPTKDTFSITERKIYDAVTFEGISAGKLAKKTGLTIRKIYKCLRCLKGKKLVFTRTIPKTYELTCNGEKLALALQDIQQVVEETWKSSEEVVHANTFAFKAGGLSNYAFLR